MNEITLHEEFKKSLGFQNYWATNFNGWIDCIDEISNELTIIEIINTTSLNELRQDLLLHILSSAAFVNHRKIDQNEQPTLMISIDN